MNYQGVSVVAVRKESPALKADILPGDILLSIDGQ
jgi:C-terminal processing protease CtpA/Prc